MNTDCAVAMTVYTYIMNAVNMIAVFRLNIKLNVLQEFLMTVNI